MIGDKKEFFKDHVDNYGEYLSSNIQQAEENYIKNRTDKIKEKQVKDSIKTGEQLYKKQFSHNVDEYGNTSFIKNKTDQIVAEQLNGKPEFNEDTVSGKKPLYAQQDLSGTASIPVSTMNAGNNTDTKVETQQNQLKEQDEAQKKSSLPQPVKEDKTAQSSSPVIAAIPKELGGMMPPDYLNLSQWNAGFQDNNMNIAHG